MKLLFAALVLLVGCQTSTSDRSQSVDSFSTVRFEVPGNLEISAGPMSAADFVAACERTSGVDFTYDEPTGVKLEDATLQFAHRTHVPASEALGFMAAILGAHGFTIRPIGTECLHKLLVESIGS